MDIYNKKQYRLYAEPIVGITKFATKCNNARECLCYIC